MIEGSRNPIYASEVKGEKQTSARIRSASSKKSELEWENDLGMDWPRTIDERMRERERDVEEKRTEQKFGEWKQTLGK